MSRNARTLTLSLLSMVLAMVMQRLTVMAMTMIITIAMIATKILLERKNRFVRGG